MRLDLFDPADQELAGDIRTGQTGNAGTLHHGPVHAIVLLKPKKVLAMKRFPAFLSVDLFSPRRSQRRKHAGGAAVLHGVSKSAALRERAKAVLVFSRQRHITRIESEIRAFWSVVTHPFERLYPGILRRAPRDFEMLRSGSKSVLRISHSGAQRHKKKRPAPGRFLQEKLADKSAGKKKHHHVKQMQKAHWLDFRQILLVRDEYRHAHEQNSIDSEGLAKKPHGTEAVAAGKPGKSDQNGERTERTQPFIPGPVAQEKIRTRLENGVILRSDRRKQSAREVWNPFRNSDGSWKKTLEW